MSTLSEQRMAEAIERADTEATVFTRSLGLHGFNRGSKLNDRGTQVQDRREDRPEDHVGRVDLPVLVSHRHGEHEGVDRSASESVDALRKRQGWVSRMLHRRTVRKGGRS